jgi:hypothetical protein
LEGVMTCSHHRPSRAAPIVAAVMLAYSAISCARDKAQPAPSPTKDEPRVVAAAVVESAVPGAGQPATRPSTAAVKPAATPNGRAGDPCPQICERTVTLGCGPRNECMTACAQVNDGSICAAEMSAFMGCALEHPTEHWECADNGVAAIRDGYCDQQQLAVLTCFRSSVR